VEDGDQGLQITTLALPKSDNLARHVRLGATRGHGPFASVHKVAVYGSDPGPMMPTPPPAATTTAAAAAAATVGGDRSESAGDAVP
ncbi:hypothetical protein HDU86_008369, partial [Geranomyces michiganensis]